MSGIFAGLLETLTELPRLYVTLGGVVLYDHEIPSSLSGGGDQTISEHKYPGGTRTLDTFGPDDHDLEWEGTLLDLNAETRCHQLDSMRRQGLRVQLTWSTFSYIVVVRTFTFDFQRPWQIPYRIKIAVVQDQLFPATSGDTKTVTEQASSDVSTANSNTSSDLNPYTGTVADGSGGTVVAKAGSPLAQQLDANPQAFTASNGTVFGPTYNAQTGVAIDGSSGNVIAKAGSPLAQQLNTTPGAFTSGGYTFGPTYKTGS